MGAIVYTPSKVKDVLRYELIKIVQRELNNVEGYRITLKSFYYCLVLHVLIDKRQSNPLESIKMSTFIL